MGSNEVELGYVAGVFGVQGELRLHVHNRESDLFTRARTVTLVSPLGVRRVVELKARSGAGKRVIGRVPGVTDPTMAEALSGWRIVVPAEELPPAESGEFYLYQVVGLRAFVGDQDVGVIVDVHTAGPVDLFEVDVGGDVQFVPALKELVLSVAPETGRVVFAEDAIER